MSVTEVASSTFKGNVIGRMTRDELLEVIGYLIEEGHGKDKRFKEALRYYCEEKPVEDLAC